MLLFGINIQGHLAIIISHRFIPNDVMVLSPHLLSQPIYINRSGIDLFERNLFSISFGYVHSKAGCTFSSLISISVFSCFTYFEKFSFVGHSLLHLVIPPPSLPLPGMFCRESTNLFCSINQIVFQVLPTLIQSFTRFISLDVCIEKIRKFNLISEVF